MTTINEPPHVTIEQNPAVLKPDWIPPTSPFTILTELHEDHTGTLEDLKRVSGEIHATRAQFQREDDQALEAARAAYAEGKDDAQLPKRTSALKRDERVTTLETRAQVVLESLRVLIGEVVQAVQEHQHEWSATLIEQEEEARAKVLALRQQLAIAEEEATAAPDLRRWIERTAKNIPGTHLHWGWFQHEKPTTDLLTIANQSIRGSIGANAVVQKELARNGGGMDPTTTEVPDYSDEVADYTSAEYEQELAARLQAHVAATETSHEHAGGSTIEQSE